MKLLLCLFFAVLSSFPVFCQDDYIMEIGGQKLNISLDKKYDVVINGKKVNFQVHMKDTLEYNDSVLSFKYPHTFKISKTATDNFEQIMILTAEGSGFLIQKYSTMNPTTLNEIMMNEVMKKNLSYGFKAERTDFKKTLKSGQIISVIKNVLTYKDKENTYEIASIGKKDEGIIILTMIMAKNNSVQGEKLIDLMWKTLQYK